MNRLVFLLSLVIVFLASAQGETTVILVRHAEKETDGTRNPPLSKEGQQRSLVLAEMFAKQPIGAIYSTNFLRTTQTVQPLADQKGLEIQLYDWKDPKSFLQSILESSQAGTIVISGHSNTTPILANLLLGEEKFEFFHEDDYANILVIQLSELGQGRLLHLRY